MSAYFAFEGFLLQKKARTAERNSTYESAVNKFKN